MLFQVEKIYESYGFNRLWHFVSKKLRQMPSLDNSLLAKKVFLEKLWTQIKRIIE